MTGRETSKSGDSLTPREQEVFGYLLTDKFMKEIAAQMVISLQTLKNYCTWIYMKKGVTGGRMSLMAREIELLRSRVEELDLGGLELEV